jgi:uncharacterized protein with HEPN domain
MDIKVKKCLTDVLLAIEGIETISLNITMESLQQLQIKWSLERGISIIGEAIYKAHKLDKSLTKTISNITQIKATRHIIIHDYDIVDSSRIFGIVKKFLPVLKIEIELLLKE